jgi:hypothetical protein
VKTILSNKYLTLTASILLLEFSLFYLANGIYSGDHWKFVETAVGLFLASLIFYWQMNLKNPEPIRQLANKRIKKSVVALIIFAVVILQAFLILFGLAMSNG